MTGMRCLVCGAEMHLIEAKPDETLMFLARATYF